MTDVGEGACRGHELQLSLHGSSSDERLDRSTERCMCSLIDTRSKWAERTNVNV